MTVTIRPYRGQKDHFEVDITITLPDGQIHRERRKAPARGKAAARTWGRERERYLLQNGPRKRRKVETPTVREFEDRYIREHHQAKHHKASTIEDARQSLRTLLGPIIGDVRLDQIDALQVQRVRAGLADKNALTVNKALSTLSTMLKCAVGVGVIPASSMPTIKRVRAKSAPQEFWGFDEYARLVAAAKRPVDRVAVLLGGDAGMRWGEIRGLQWDSVDFSRKVIVVQRALWRDVLDVPKGGKSREVPMTARLSDALQALSEQKHGPFVLCRAAVSWHRTELDRPVGQKWLLQRLDVLCPAADVKANGPHTLRHTFCSHLAMRGTPARVIQDLAGHASLMTTERYMHLAPGLARAAIASLETAPPLGIPHP